MLDLYTLLKQHRVYIRSLDELHAVRETLIAHHPDADLDYIANDNDWKDYPLIACEEDELLGDIFVGLFYTTRSNSTDLSVSEFLATIASEEESDVGVDLSSLL